MVNLFPRFPIAADVRVRLFLSETSGNVESLPPEMVDDDPLQLSRNRTPVHRMGKRAWIDAEKRGDSSLPDTNARNFDHLLPRLRQFAVFHHKTFDALMFCSEFTLSLLLIYFTVFSPANHAKCFYSSFSGQFQPFRRV